MSDSSHTPLHATDAASLRYIVRFEPDGPSFEVAADQPLVSGAERAALQLPSACRNGTCRTCMCRVLSGQVRYRIQWPGLSAEEKREGWILPCIAYAQSDLVLSRPRNFNLPDRD